MYRRSKFRVVEHGGNKMTTVVKMRYHRLLITLCITNVYAQDILPVTKNRGKHLEQEILCMVVGPE